MFPPERRSEAPEFQCVICGTIAEGEGPVCGSPACQSKSGEVAETIWGRLPLNAEERS